MISNGRNIKNRILHFITSFFTYLLGFVVILLMYGNALITPFFEQIPIDKLITFNRLFIKYTLNSIIASLYLLFLSSIVTFQFDAGKVKVHKIMSLCSL